MRTTLLKISNYVLFVSMCAVISAGFALEFRLPSGREGHGLALLGLARHDWKELHFIVGLIFVATAITHLFLNWSWIVKVATRGNRTLLAMTIGVGLLLIALPLLFPLGVAPARP